MILWFKPLSTTIPVEALIQNIFPLRAMKRCDGGYMFERKGANQSIRASAHKYTHVTLQLLHHHCINQKTHTPWLFRYNMGSFLVHFLEPFLKSILFGQKCPPLLNDTEVFNK